MSPFGGPETSERWHTRAVTPPSSCALLLLAGSGGRGAISKCLITLFFGLFALAARGAGEPAQHFPDRPLTLVVGAAAGGGIDINARLLAMRLADYFGQSVIVENRPGAGSKIANEYVAKATPDGYTLLVATAAMTIDMAFHGGLEIDTLRALTPVSTISSTQMILVVNPSVPAKNVRELIARARAMPGELNYSSAGPGTTAHLYGELFKLRTGTDIVHVPFKGTAPSLSALVAGHVDLSFATVPGVLQYVRAGKLIPLATTGGKRSEVMPDVPTMDETGFAGMEASVWYGVLAPAATPREVVSILARAIDDASRSPDFRRQLLDLGEEPMASSPGEFANLLREEVARWSQVIKAAGIRAD
jgi:tripartite-type tricarboxylate transporter receptor subunit TctC